MTTRLLFVGPMLGGHAGWVPSPAEVVGPLLEGTGCDVRLTSTRLQPVVRVADQLRCLLHRGHGADLVILLVYSGRAFAVADLLGWVAKRLLRRPLVLWLHGGNLPDFATRHPRWVQRVLSRGDALVCPSRFLADTFDATGKTTVIPNVVTLDDYPFHPRQRIAPKLLWMRTFHPIYNPALAVRTVAELHRRGRTDVTLTMAGQDAGLLDETRGLAERLGVHGAVRFIGFLDADAKRRTFAEHDVFLNTNQVDNMPVSIVEAGAFGVPVVATEVGGISALLTDGHDGLLIPDDDTDAMAAAVERLLDEPTLASRLSQSGRVLAERCAWPAVAPCWQTVIERFAAAD